ncbi:MAG: sigma-54-dependent Fis family transcriptional regulator [Chlorobi bacterium]|nr:sigma-54-dependent Fis family transcriptional regulator [Chlorobiota bacterium]
MIGTQPVTLITQNSQMRDILKRIDKIANSDTSVLLVGETGVGKEIFADYIHRISNRSLKSLVKIGLSALPPDLMASELFGYEKGSFTSAASSKKGLFELADSGSMFLDDIDDVPLEIQAKLLRVLESRELMRIGGMVNIPVNIRLISASKVNLNDLVEKNMFRSDLLYRINVITIEIPPLRERLDDLPLLVNYFIQRYAPKRMLKITDEALTYLLNYHWPGNVRELRNVVQRAVIFADKKITPEEIPANIKLNNPIEQIVKACSVCFSGNGMKFTEVINCLEYKLIQDALHKSGGNQSNAAKKLNLSLSTFRDKMKKFETYSPNCKNVVAENR